MKDILYLTLKRYWFDKIATGFKTIEFRDRNVYWDKRLINKQFDEVYFRNGYKPKDPFMRVECKVIKSKRVMHMIYLGKVLETRNWEGPKNVYTINKNTELSES